MHNFILTSVYTPQGSQALQSTASLLKTQNINKSHNIKCSLHRDSGRVCFETGEPNMFEKPVI
jgi:hypothetical protein